MADNISVNQGTQTVMAADDLSSVYYPRVKISVGADGVAADWQGTISSVAAGTQNTLGTVGVVNSIVAGTQNTLGTVGNLNFGTVDLFYRHVDRFATVVSTGTTTLGTIKALVSGSAIYVTDLIISAGSATVVVIGNGGTSTPMIGSLQLNQNGGMVANFVTPLATASGSALVYQQSVGCPLSITCAGYVD